MREGSVLCAQGGVRGRDGRRKAALCHALARTCWRVFSPFHPHSSCSCRYHSDGTAAGEGEPTAGQRVPCVCAYMVLPGGHQAGTWWHDGV